MSPDLAAIIIIAAMPYADRLADKIGAHRAAQRKHELAKGKPPAAPKEPKP